MSPLFFKVPATSLPPRPPAATTFMKASQDGRQRLLRTQNAITPNPPLLIGRQKQAGGLEVPLTLPSAAAGSWTGVRVGGA